MSNRRNLHVSLTHRRTNTFCQLSDGPMYRPTGYLGQFWACEVFRDTVLCHNQERTPDYEQEAQLLLGDRATRKHAKDS